MEKEFYPILLADNIPSRLLFSSDDFLEEIQIDSGNFNVIINNEFKEKLKHKIFNNYKGHFRYKDNKGIPHYVQENDIVTEGSLMNSEHNKIVIILKNKKACSYNQINYMKIVLEFCNDIIQKSEINDDTFNVKFYLKDISSSTEEEVKIFLKVDKRRPASAENKNKRLLEVRKLQKSYTLSHKPNYIDILSTDVPENSYNLKKRPNLRYLLNLRGLLHFVSFCNIENEKDLLNINQMIENLSDSDVYKDLDEEITEKCIGFKIDMIRNGEFVNEYKTMETNSPLLKLKIKKRYPFLSFYNKYKHCLPINFMTNFLFHAASRYEKRLESISIHDLKYDITKEYLNRIRNYLYNPIFPKIQYNDIEKEEQINAIRSFEDEVNVYIAKIEEKENELRSNRTKFFEKEKDRIEFERKLNQITNSNKPIVSFESILGSDGDNTSALLSPSQNKIIENFCKYGREEENDNYTYIPPFHLIKNSLLKSIEQKISKSLFDKELIMEMRNNQIPSYYKLGMKNWILSYRELLGSNKITTMIHLFKMLVLYSNYQILNTSFLFENPVFNKSFCNRLFSYFI